MSGSSSADVLEGGRGQNTFGDERDGKKDVIKVKQDKSPDRINNLDEKDVIQIQASGGSSEDATVKVVIEEIEGIGRSLVISLDRAVIAYFTGGSITTNELNSMIEVV